MIEIAMSPEQYAKAREVIRISKDVTSFSERSDITGSFSTKQIAADYGYDGSTLHVAITAKYGMAKFASEGMIQSRMQSMLAQL